MAIPSLKITVSSLPAATDRGRVFLDSGFFVRNPDRNLPTPQEVRALSTAVITHPQPPPVIFKELGLFVKFGRHVFIEEAQCLWAIKRVLPNVPVPELYGWFNEGSDLFIYMELLPGATLAERWESLRENDKIVVCEQLQNAFVSLRCLQQIPEDIFIGSINRGTLKDIVFEGKPPGGPFNSVSDFHNWLSMLFLSIVPEPKLLNDPYRCSLPDNVDIKFTHGDLHRENILITQDSPPKLVGIIDWAHAGWYPDYWEYCKAAYTSSYEGEWRCKWIPRIILPREQEHAVFAEYTMAIGAL